MKFYNLFLKNFTSELNAINKTKGIKIKIPVKMVGFNPDGPAKYFAPQ